MNNYKIKYQNANDPPSVAVGETIYCPFSHYLAKSKKNSCIRIYPVVVLSSSFIYNIKDKRFIA
jgi:hypothetical protein